MLAYFESISVVLNFDWLQIIQQSSRPIQVAAAKKRKVSESHFCLKLSTYPLSMDDFLFNMNCYFRLHSLPYLWLAAKGIK